MVFLLIFYLLPKIDKNVFLFLSGMRLAEKKNPPPGVFPEEPLYCVEACSEREYAARRLRGGSAFEVLTPLFRLHLLK